VGLNTWDRMSTPFRIAGCFILGLLVTGLAYERVVNARQELLSSAEAADKSPGGRAVVSPEVNDRGPDLAVLVKSDNFSDDVPAGGDVIDDELIEKNDASNLNDEKHLTEEEGVSDANSASLMNEKTLSENTNSSTEEISTVHEANSEENIAIRSSLLMVPSLSKTRIEDQLNSISTNPLAPELKTGLILDEVQFLNNFKNEQGKISNRRLLRADGELKFPYKIMPSDWFLKRQNATYPRQCAPAAAEKETVTVQFQVDSYGYANKPKIADATNKCFSASAIDAIRDMQFRVRAAPGYSLGGSKFLVSIEYVNKETI